MDDGLDAKDRRTLSRRCAQNVLSISRCSILPGSAYFMGYEFCVDERVLVPRQDTEVLVEEAISRMKESGETADPGYVYRFRMYSSESSYWRLPQALGTGVDVSEGALCVAKENRKRLGLEQMS